MKKIKVGAIISILVFSITGCGGLSVEKPENPKNITEDSDLSMDYRKFIASAEETAEKANSDYPFTQEELEQTLKTVIEDDIWFENQESKFYHCINQEIEFVYKYTKYDHSDEGYVTVLPLIEPHNKYSFYYIMSLHVYDGKLRDGVSYSGMQNLDKLKALLIPETTGRGTVSIGERHKPLYDADEEDIKRAKENILRWLDGERTIGGGSHMEDVYIRNFYKTSVETVMFYTYEGERCCCPVFLDAKTKGSAYLMGNKPFEVDEADPDYKRMMECSFPLGETPSLDEETENALKRMIEEKTEKKLKTAIEDDIWFKGEESIFYPYINQDIQYEYYYEYYYRRKGGYVQVLPLIKPGSQSRYCILQFAIDDNVLNLDHQFYFREENLEELKAEHMQEVLGKGAISIGERRKPPYDADEADIEAAKENIRGNFEYLKKVGIWDMIPDHDEEIYIRNFYKGSIHTIMFFTYKGEQYYVYADLDGKSISASYAVEESQEYVNRMLECSFPLYE